MSISNSFPFPIQNNKILIPLLHNLGINHHDRNEGCVLSVARVIADSVMATRKLAEALACVIHLGRVTVHPAEELTLNHSGGDGRTRVSMRRCPAVRTIVDFETNDGLAGCVGELVVIKNLDGFARAITGTD